MSTRDQLVNLLGSESVSDDEALLSSYPGKYSPLFVVWPRSTEQVVKVVRWANETSTPLVPASSGRPGMRGSALPKVEKSVVIDLSRMDRILRVDPRNRVVMLEPGVRYDSLVEELKVHGLRPLMPLLPRPDKSVVASCLDREPISTPRFHWDSSDPLLCTETVFGTGDVLRTGSAAGPGSLEEQWASGQAQKNPMGPSQFDPFRLVQGSQGTIGIVTWISMKCETIPEFHRFYFAGASNLGALSEFSRAVLKRRLADEQFIMNSVSFEAAFGPSKNLPPWILVLGISGQGLLAKDEVEYRTADTVDIARACGVELVESLGGVDGSYLKGRLTGPSSSPYWKLQKMGSCQEVLFTTTLGQVPELLGAFLEISSEVGFPTEQIGVYVQPVVQGVSVHCCFDLYHQSGDAAEFERVLLLLSRGQERLLRDGAFFSRPYGMIAEEVFGKTSPEVVEAMRRVKSIFDPSGILSPGNLCFKELST
jgi:hypothetical protein